MYAVSEREIPCGAKETKSANRRCLIATEKICGTVAYLVTATHVVLSTFGISREVGATAVDLDRVQDCWGCSKSHVDKMIAVTHLTHVQGDSLLRIW